ncbi:transport system permease protein [Paracidovorax avenae ATCC 19860]|uniref:Transport system permease protein n=1 Tax=Paracidovorax avenae (strain ATCC 19860 / DSM 7227 / CCUG 15838 / JCM 20985 / LMG 2117 / NCPPB 1011) TaxID=643561 RepID=F0Q9E3_PARA1|nr:iron ABC transporter permease [Paracidovorax avenae]ADX48388.1 transport system permease protein [Paracidovorax avenae ATCC 19860]
MTTAADRINPALPLPSRPATPQTPLQQAYRRLAGLRLLVLAALAAGIAAALLLDFTTGPSGLSLAQLGETLLDAAHATPALRVIVWDIRMPYALMAVAVGLALGLAGAEMQTVLANPLASPFTLGLSSAAAFGAALAIVLDWSLPGIPAAWAVPANAFLFAMASALLLDLVARWGGMSATGVVLFGIALVFSFNALVSLLQFVATAEALQGLVFWTMGSLSRATWPKLAVLALALAAVVPFSLANAWRLTALRLGEDRAASFGVDVRRLRLGALLRISLLAALSVAFVGSIGFIGLVAPHIARRLVGDDHRFYLPAAALTGALVLSLASVASKTLIGGVVIPVGIVTSLVGIPFFLAIVLRTRGRA